MLFVLESSDESIKQEILLISECVVKNKMSLNMSKTKEIVILTFYVMLSMFFFSSPNLSQWRLDVCHTSTHGVALAQI